MVPSNTKHAAAAAPAGARGLKTIPDKEFFASGDIPGDCISEALFVDQTGRLQEVIFNQKVSNGANSRVS